LTATGRHPYRPGHVHFLVSADGHEPVTTHAFVSDSPYIDSDAVFAVKKGLLVDFSPCDDAELAARFGVSTPFTHARFDVQLNPQSIESAEC
jgi:hydroxyquinol 1,2-dioxygenase